MIGFIDDHRTSLGVEPICRELPIAPSTYHAHAARRADPTKPPPRVRRDAQNNAAGSGGSGKRASGSMACERSGGSSAVKASVWPAALRLA